VIERIGVPEALSFRINPGIGKGDRGSNVLAGPDAKYGIPWEKAGVAYARARDMGVKRFGIHMMTGSNVLDEAYFGEITLTLFDIVAQIKKETGVEIDCMNIGGGFGVPYRPDEKSVDVEAVAKNVRFAFDTAIEKYNLKEPELMIEPGRYIGADAGWLVGKVVSIKDGYKRFIGIDASANDMPRPSIYGAYHHVTIMNDSDEMEIVSVVGSICENNDQFGKDRTLPKASIGDTVVIHNCGAHAHAMGHNYNGKPRHAEYMVESGGNIKKIRRAETVEDLFATTNI
jgi:diaminopimelate decarboxylase